MSDSLRGPSVSLVWPRWRTRTDPQRAPRPGRLFIVDPSSGLVYDVQFDTVCQITSDFLASLLIGLSLHTDLEEMISRVQSRYFATPAGLSPSSYGMWLPA